MFIAQNLRKLIGLLTGLIIFAFLIPAFSFAAIPSVGAISPSSGASNPEQQVSFTATYSDPDGWKNIQYVYFLINTSTSRSNCFFAYYNQNTNKLYLRNDADSAWLGGYALRSSYSIENTYAKLHCGVTTISGSGNTLTVKWSVTFKDKFSARTNNCYLYVKDDANLSAGYTQKGSWTITSSSPQNKIPFEAETATFVSPFVIGSDANASAGRYLHIPNGSGSNYTSPGGPGVASFTFNVPAEDTYNVWAPVIAPSGYDDSFFVRIDAGPVQYWSITNGSSWKWVQVKDSITGTFYARLTPGLHTLYFRQREDGPKLDKIIIINDPLFVPGPEDVTNPDSIPPTGTIKINNDSQYANSASVTLNLSAQDNSNGSGLAQMQFSNDNLIWSTPESYASAKAWALASGEGEKTVYVKFSDKAGNWSLGYSDSITLDTTPPNISLNPVLSPTNQNVVLSYVVSDNFTPLEQILTAGDQSPYINEASHNVSLTANDLAGNSASASVSFTIDKTAPVIVITSPQDGAVVEDSSIQLQGTVDAAAFSESRTLNPGENTLTKTATDAAGNSASASVNVYLYLGELIGSEGGEAASQDGKVKVIIPPGALNSPAWIGISKINKDTLQEAAPNGRTLLSVVECKPYGLLFSKPVEIIYSLEQAEIPGTSVELGFYDSAQGKIISTGQASKVASDGYAVSFSLEHFSTYAALKSFVSQGSAIGAWVKIPLPDMLSGSFSTGIPITVVPGRKGLQPSLGLSYRSSNPNSWVGLGFSLNSGFIARSTRLGPPNYDDTRDTFYLITDSGTTELVYLIDNLYQSKIESNFTKFYKEPDDSWKVVAKDGSILRFGQTPDAKETSNSGAFSWYLSKAQDTNGNYITYSYTKDQGKSYLSKIDYTGNEMGITPANSVEFFLEPREDILSNYISGSRIATTRRLKEIRVKLNSELVWKYVLEYAYSPDTNRSLLQSVTQYAADGKSLPAQKMEYQKPK